VVTYVVFALLAAAIVTFITIGYRSYKKDMYLPAQMVTIAMHDASQLQPTLYAMKDPGDPVEKGTVTKVRQAAEPTVSATEKVLWVITGVMALGVIVGVAMAAMGRWNIGKFVAGGAAVVMIVLGGAAWYQAVTRETPYEIALQPQGKPGEISFAAHTSTPVTINKIGSAVPLLKEGMMIQATLTREADEAIKIISPIPAKDPGNPVEKGVITKIRQTAEPPVTLAERVSWGVAGVMALGAIVGVAMVVVARWKIGQVVAGVAAVLMMMSGGLAWYQAKHRDAPYEITLQPQGKPAEITFAAHTSTPVKINKEESSLLSLEEGATMQVTLARDMKEAISMVSPIPEKATEVLPMLRLPLGFRGYAKRDEPKYMSSVELKENYLSQSYTVSRGEGGSGGGEQTFQVSKVDRGTLDFTAFSRSLRLAALHDFKGVGAKMLEEGPMVIEGGKTVAWENDEQNSPLNVGGEGKVNAYTLLMEGRDADGKLVRSRQIAIQGETQGEKVMMYVIKGTAPAADWPAIGEVFDSAISTFTIAAVPEEKPEEKP